MVKLNQLGQTRCKLVLFGMGHYILPPGDPQLTDHFLPPLLGWQAVAAMRECDPRGEERLNIVSLSVPAWIIGSIVMQVAGCLED